MNKPALFLDVDHTVIKPKSGNTFPEDKHDWMWIDGILDLITRYYRKGYQIVFVTNQAGVAYGYTTENELEYKFIRMRQKLAKYLANELGLGVELDELPLYYCPDKESYHRKPNPGMAYQAAMDYDINLKASFMLGDRESDKRFAKNAGIGEFHYVHQFLN